MLQSTSKYKDFARFALDDDEVRFLAFQWPFDWPVLNSHGKLTKPIGFIPVVKGSLCVVFIMVQSGFLLYDEFCSDLFITPTLSIQK